ncbi:glycosyltransferase family 4 protein [Methanothermococcus sp. Ax23]|uniref:glycosyltransferase family 4 protein n=1 Tax=Methanothermococcus sp. Ax23 TaxID=3156486 RepID=UPI003BA3D693
MGRFEKYKNKKNDKVVLFSFYGRSGMWHYATQYANALSKFKNVYLVCPKFAKKDFVNYNNNLSLIEIDASPSIKKFIIETLNLHQHINLFLKILKMNPTTLHFLDNHPWSVIYAVIFKLLGYKIIFTQHDPIQHTGEPRGDIQGIINKLQMKLGNYIIIHSEFLKNMVLKKFNISKNKIIIYPHGHYAFLLKYKKDNIREEPYTVLFFGRILKYKGLDLLLKSLLILKEEGCKFKLIIAGEGDLKPYKKLINKLKGYIEIHNKYIAEEDIPYYFQKACLVALTYHDATQSGIIPIAYPFGRPVIVTKVGGLPEVVINGKTGYIVDKNPEEIAKSIKNILYNPSVQDEMKENCKKATYKLIDWKKNLKKILYIYN